MTDNQAKEQEKLNVVKFEETKALSIDKIFGQDHIKKELQDIHMALSNLELYKQCGATLTKGYLFVGKPGTGKTMSARAISSDTPAKVAYIKVSDVTSNLMDGRAVNLKNMIEQIEERSKEHPVIVIFDEIDYLLVSRAKFNITDATTSAVNLLLEWMDGVVENKDIIVIGCTNILENIDPAFLRSGRFEKKLIFNDLTSEDISNIIASNVIDYTENGSPITKNLTKRQHKELLGAVDEIAEEHDLNGADARFCVENAIKERTIELISKYDNIDEIREAIKEKDEPYITTEDIVRHLEGIVKMNSESTDSSFFGFEKSSVLG